MSEQEVKTRRKYRPSFIWPLILITVGVVFLLSNLGIIGEDIWDNLWRLWPVLFIAIGLDSLFRRNEIAGPVFMIGLGVIILLSSIGMIGWGTWQILIRLWPVMLVAVGLEIIIGRRSLVVSFLSVIVIVGLLGAFLWFYGDLAPAPGNRLQSEIVNQVLEDIDQAEIRISPAVGELQVDGKSKPGSLISGEVSSGRATDIYTAYALSGKTGIFTIEDRALINFPSGQSWNWDLGISDQIPLVLDLAMGAGDMQVKLSGLTLTRVDVSQGAGEIQVTLADEGDFDAEISQGVGSIVVEIPRDIAVRIEFSRAISSLSMPPGFEKDGDYYYSSDYNQADKQVTLSISQAVGSILIRYK